VETHDALFVDVNDIWLPNRLFRGCRKQPERGNVYRISCELFQFAYAIQEEVNTDVEFLKRLEDSGIAWSLRDSDKESAALSEWNKMQINVNQEMYHANPDRQLPKKGGDTRPLPPMTR
jgi:hypothetical protein